MQYCAHSKHSKNDIEWIEDIQVNKNARQKDNKMLGKKNMQDNKNARQKEHADRSHLAP